MPRNINVPEAVEIFYGTITSNFGTYGQNLNVIKEALAYFCYWRKHSCRSNQTWSNSWRCSTQFLRVFNVPWYWSPKIERKIICHNGSWCSYSWQRIDSKNMACHGLDFCPIKYINWSIKDWGQIHSYSVSNFAVEYRFGNNI